MSEYSNQSDDIPMPTQAEVDELLAFLSVFSAPEYEPVRQWHGGPAGKPQTLTPFPAYDDAVSEFIDVASKDCWKDRSYVSSGASRMLEEDGGIEGASLADIKSMLTFCVRGERFCDGHVGGMIASGHVAKILKRLAKISKPGGKVMTTKEAAYDFLKSLHKRLERELPEPAAMRAAVDDIVESAVADPSKRHLKGREQAFLNALATPVVFRVLADYPDMDSTRAREAFITESYRCLPEYSKGSPARRLRHPFNKALSVDSDAIYRQWCGETKYRPITQSCPDFAFRSPFPHKIVFEAKYFQSDSISSAQRELVVSAYQAFFYRGLPRDVSDKRRPDWDFDYACVFAYDASRDGVLLEAWERLAPEVKRGFWEGANVYVMVLRGTRD